MSEKQSWRDTAAERDAATAEAAWGIRTAPDERWSVSAVDLARQAYERGDRLLQIDLPVSVVQGWVGVGQVASRTWRPEAVDILGLIEAQGWRLEHVASTFVTNGSSATKRVMANAGSTEVAYHGAMVALYVFRRSEQPHNEGPRESGVDTDSGGYGLAEAARDANNGRRV